MATSKGKKVKADEILVQFEPGADAAAKAQALEAVGEVFKSIKLMGGAHEQLGELARVKLAKGADPEAAADLLSQHGAVRFAEPDYVVNDLAVSNDPYYTGGSVWGLYGDQTSPANVYGSQAGEAWAAGHTGASKVVVGVIDSGVDYTHQDLYLNIWLNPGEIPQAMRSGLVDGDQDGMITFRDLNRAENASFVRDVNANGRIDGGDLLNDARWENGADEDANGYRDDLIGWDWRNDDNDPYDDRGHGTHVAGTIGAIGGNGAGVAGVAWSAQIVVMKFLGSDGSGYTSDAVMALDYFSAASQAPGAGAFVATNNSWGGGGPSVALSDAISRGAARDLLFVASAGNGGADQVGDDNDAAAYYPSSYNTTASAGYDAVVAVASITSTGARSSFSNYGATSVDLAAPGSSILSTVPGDGYGSKSGTSMAAPHVTGAVALYAAANPGASAAQIRTDLLASTLPTPSLAGITVTGGRLNVQAMLARSAPGGASVVGTAAGELISPTGAPAGQPLPTALADTLSGLGGDDTLDGGAGADVLVGGLGSDSYIVDGGDQVVEAAGAGTDSVTASVSFSLGANVEKLSLGGALAINGVGNELANELKGNGAANRLEGRDGNDTLSGGLGGDTLDGGAGVDTASYADATAGVKVSLALAGAQNTGVAGADQLTAVENLIGSGFADTLAGDAASNQLFGAAGADSLDGGAGADTLDGGLGDDSYVVDNASDVVIEAAGAGAETVTASVSFSLGANVEKLSLGGALAINGVGNELANELKGNGAANRLEGRDGNDTLSGGLGGDTLDGGAGVDTASYADATAGVKVSLALAGAQNTGVAGADQLIAVENLIGSGFADTLAGDAASNQLFGAAGADSLDGGAGADTLDGGLGDDSYLVDNAADVVVEAAGAGTDTVGTTLAGYTLGANLENLTYAGAAAFQGAGNAAANTLTGGAGGDTLQGGGGADKLNGLAGADSLDGGAGDDSLDGGGGDDTYVVDSVNDRVSEMAGGGVDTVRTALTSYTLAAELENLVYTNPGLVGLNAVGNAAANTITGGGGADTLKGGGGADTLSGGGADDRLLGGGGADSLDGGVGADTLEGGAGDDTYLVDASGDRVVELASAGTDTVRTALSSYTLAEQVETLTFIGAGSFFGGGNALGNTLNGGAGADTLFGAGGSDKLYGGAGSDRLQGGDGADSLSGGADGDRFVFATAAEASNGSIVDTILDYSRAAGDLIDLAGIDANALVAGDQAFTWIGGAAFSRAAGQLRFAASGPDTLVNGDVNGDGVADFTVKLVGAVPLTSADFLL